MNFEKKKKILSCYLFCVYVIVTNDVIKCLDIFCAASQVLHIFSTFPGMPSDSRGVLSVCGTLVKIAIQNRRKVFTILRLPFANCCGVPRNFVRGGL